MLTEGQALDLERLRKYIHREQLTSCMNDTKWRAAISAIQGVSGYRAGFRTRVVTDTDDPPDDHWDGSFPYHVPILSSSNGLNLTQ